MSTPKLPKENLVLDAEVSQSLVVKNLRNIGKLEVVDCDCGIWEIKLISADTGLSLGSGFGVSHACAVLDLKNKVGVKYNEVVELAVFFRVINETLRQRDLVNQDDSVNASVREVITHLRNCFPELEIFGLTYQKQNDRHSLCSEKTVAHVILALPSVSTGSPMPMWDSVQYLLDRVYESKSLSGRWISYLEGR